MTEIVTLPGGNRWRVGETEFQYSFDEHSTVDRFLIRKPPDLVDLYVELCETYRHGTIVELGIASGGSTALMSLLAEPSLLVSCELDPSPVGALTEFIHRHGLSDSVRPFYGVDQSDRALLSRILDAEIGARPIDLVIDDASHLHDESRASLEVLLPRVRPGGLLIIEDWAADYVFAKRVVAVMSDQSSREFPEQERRLTAAIIEQDRLGPTTPLPRLGIELMQVAAQASDVVAELTINRHWIAVRRGPAELDHAGFRLVDHYQDYWGWTPS